MRFCSILTSRYLTLAVGQILVPLNFIFPISLNFFVLNLNMTISVFLTFSEILFAFSQLARLFMSIFTSLLSFLLCYLQGDGCYTEFDSLIKVIDI